MILVIRIAGGINMSSDSKETLFRLGLRRKYSAILLKESEQTQKILQVIRNFVAYGPISPKTLELLISKRGQSLNKTRVDAKRVASELDKKSLEELGLKPYFRLHPPRRGINSKVHFPKGVLADNGEKINELVERML